MTTISPVEREAQRVAHLVLERPRPKRPVTPVRPAGLSNAAWKAERKRLLAEPVRLAPGIEQQIALREEYGGGRATPQTRLHAALEHDADRDPRLPRLVRAGVLTEEQLAAAKDFREGSLARLLRSGALDAHQLAAAEEIRLAHAAVIADVAVRTARWERGTGGGGRTSAADESYGQVRRQLAYTAWREAVAPHAAMLLAIVIDDLALTAAAQRWRMSNRRAGVLLADALDRWRRG